ncbi:MAG: trypsin-like peptidase domain-containing protein [Lachnospiraceae bacterium]|nr:trypsin-like peptidase domain-containing protein [Lachnospiraceae bacterium]
MYEDNNFENRDYNWERQTETPTPQKQEKKSGGFFRKIMVAACCGLCFGLFAGVGLFAVDMVKSVGDASKEQVYQTSGADSVVVEQPEEKDAGKNKEEIKTTGATQVSVVTSDYSEVVERVMPAMVSILNTYTVKQSYWGQTYTQEAQSGGSGIIIAENETELLLATNNHVVDGADKLEVTFIDGSIAEAQIKGKDSDMDLAVIAIPLDTLTDETKEAIAIAKMGDSDSLRLGEPVIAIGNALGYGQSVTGGYISALNREIEVEDGSTGTFIQTDAAINHGNSGGALLNIKGEVIGINSNKISGTSIEGMGYAIPISAAEPIIGDLMTKETRHKVTDGNVGYIGIVNSTTVPDEMIVYYNFPAGVFVRSVAEDSPAAEAGIINNDIIVEFDGEKITTYEELQDVLQYYAPGEEAVITVMRQTKGQYEEVEIPIVLGTRPENK